MLELNFKNPLAGFLSYQLAIVTLNWADQLAHFSWQGYVAKKSESLSKVWSIILKPFHIEMHVHTSNLNTAPSLP